MKKFRTFFLSIASALAVGALAGFLTKDATYAYSQTANLPPLNPPAVLFPIVWTILYILMGVSLGLVLTNPRVTNDAKLVSVSFFVLNLCFNFLWPIWFFVFGLYWFSFVWLILLLLVVILMTLVFSATSKVAALLQLPYILWLLFASYLNVAVALLN